MASPYLSNYGVVTVAAATLAITEEGHAGQTIVSNLAATQTFTLPSATGTGNTYRVFVNITKTGDLIIQVTTTDIMQGGVAISSAITGVTMLAAATSDTMTINGTTKGGIKGTWVEFQDVASGTWRVGGFMVSSGTETDPFSAAVS